jgi:hypothetical protein
MNDNSKLTLTRRTMLAATAATLTVPRAYAR